jgi:hypothetical protein
MADYSEGFYITIGGMFIGFLGLTIRYAFRSKCDEVSCCGCHIHRAVDVEERLEEAGVPQNIGDSVK